MPIPGPFLRATACVATLWLLGWIALAPGLHGGFLFDDYVNLDALGATGPVDDWPTFWRYLTSGMADPTGRPLALLSFLLDARDWPADPAPFLRTNLLLHLANGALLFALLRRLGGWTDGAGARTDAIAALGAGAWLLHPLFVSTTFYIVQREAMLPATCVLLGLLAWVHGRAQLDRAPRTGTAWMVVAILVATPLALLAKANGILLPLLVLMLEATVLRMPARGSHTGDATRRRLHWLRIGLLGVPTLVVLAYLAGHLPHLHDDQPLRGWTIAERLLTEPRVVVDYLHLLLVPQVLSSGLYNDALPASTGLLQPATTLPALLLVLALLALAFALRRRAPVVAAALLFFFAGHLLESTAVPLELYFEHRNYLPALLLPWPLARAVWTWRAPTAVRAATAVALLLLLGTTAHQRAMLWSRPDQMTRLWAVQHPASSRAQADAAIVEMQAGRPDLALARLALLVRRRPHDLQLVLNHADAACMAGRFAQGDAALVAQALRHAVSAHNLAWRWLDHRVGTAVSPQCAGMDAETVSAWLRAASANPMMQAPGRRQDLAALAGRLALSHGDAEQALAHFDRALEAYVTPGAAARQAALLATAGRPGHALAHLDHYRDIAHREVRARGWNMPSLHRYVLEREGYWPRELARLRATLEAEVAASGGGTARARAR